MEEVRKPLDLVAYDLEAFPHLVAKARTAGRKKRLTDAELAAEVNSAVFHEAECEVRGLRLKDSSGPAFDHWVKWNHEFGRRADILERFATHDHYDEGDS